MKSEYNAGRQAGFIHAINCTDIPDGEKDWGYNVFFFHGENYVAYALRSYPNTSDVGYMRFADSNGWVADWQKIAAADTPEVHELPLNIAGSDNSSYYAKDQFGRVYVSIRTSLNANWNDYKIIGTLPEGFRPVWDAVTPLLIQNDPLSYQIGEIVIQPGGDIYVRGSFMSTVYIFAQLTYPAAD